MNEAKEAACTTVTTIALYYIPGGTQLIHRENGLVSHRHRYQIQTLVSQANDKSPSNPHLTLSFVDLSRDSSDWPCLTETFAEFPLLTQVAWVLRQRRGRVSSINPHPLFLSCFLQLRHSILSSIDVPKKRRDLLLLRHVHATQAPLWRLICQGQYPSAAAVASDRHWQKRRGIDASGHFLPTSTLNSHFAHNVKREFTLNCSRLPMSRPHVACAP